MQNPYIGRSIALVLIAGLVGWTAFRALGSRPPESPKNPFPAPAIDTPLATAKSQQTAVFAGGCFWGVQAVFQHLKGVSSVTSGYAGGFIRSPSYESVSIGVTGHAESVSIIYDPSQLTYGQLLMVFFSVAHDPTQWNRHKCGAAAHRSGLYRAARRREGLFPAYRHETRAFPCFLSRGELSSGLPQEQSR